MAIPVASRPDVPGYGVPEEGDGMLEWAEVAARLQQAQNYWIATADSRGRPHSVPTWGAWIDGVLYFGGGPDTRWSRNLAANPRASVHLEDGTRAVILEGAVGRITDATDPRVSGIDDVYEAKYGMRHGVPFWVLEPEIAFAWASFPSDATRWRFDGRGS